MAERYVFSHARWEGFGGGFVGAVLVIVFTGK